MADRNGPELQRAGIARFCSQWNLPFPVPEYFDTASGRRTVGRAGLQRAHDDAPDYDVLLVFHTSRAFRNRLQAAIGKMGFAESGITVIFTEQGFISGDPRTKVAEGMSEIMDEAASDTLSMFVSQGLRQKFERGQHNGTALLGYERHYGPPGDPSNSDLVVVLCEAATVRRIYELYRTGRYSDLEIALAINAEVDAEGRPLHRTKRGKPFTEGGIRGILTNRIYTGLVVWHPYMPEEEWRQGRHEAIVSQELFEEVLAIRATRVHWSGRRSVARVYPLSRRGFCFDCGMHIAGDTGGQKNRRRYRHSRSGLCAGWRSHHAHVLEGQLGEFMATSVSLPTEWQTEVLKLIKQPATAPSDHDQRRTKIEQALEALRKQHMWSDISDEQYRSQRQELQRAFDEIPRDQKTPFAVTDYSRSARMLSEFGTLWNHRGVSDESRKAFIEEVFEQVQIDELGIRAVKPAEEFLPLMAIATWGDTARENPVSRSKPLPGNPSMSAMRSNCSAPAFGWARKKDRADGNSDYRGRAPRDSTWSGFAT